MACGPAAEDEATPSSSSDTKERCTSALSLTVVHNWINEILLIFDSHVIYPRSAGRPCIHLDESLNNWYKSLSVSVIY